MDTTSIQRSGNTLKSIHPYVEQDVRDSVKVDLYPWVEAVFGISRERIDKWTSQIGSQQWFHDDIIQRHLTDYCKAKEEPDRYEPFCGFSNRILDLARGNLDGIRANESYPVDSLQFISTSQCNVSRTPEQGKLGAKRKLDITLTHGEAAHRFKEAKKIDWVDVLHSVELKFVSGLTDVLSKEMKARERDSGKSNTTKKTTQPKNVRRSTRLLNTRIQRSSETSDPQEGVRTGGKRQRESDDPIEAMSLGPSCATSTHPQYSAYQGKQGAIQSGAYALEVLSCTYGTRVCCHSTVLKDDRLFLWYYDACGIVYTNQVLSLIHDFEKTAAIIIALASCTPERFGMLPTSIMKPPTPYATIFPPRTLSRNVLQVRHPVSGKRLKITLKDSIYTQYVLAGRRTFVYTMDASPKLSESSLMVKFSYQVNSRRPEHELIDIARKAGVEHLPEFHMWSDLWKMSDGARRTFLANPEHQAGYEDRTLRMIVSTEYGTIQKLFFERCDLIPVMAEQMVNCLHDLRYKANMLHRDISVNNIMFQKRGEDYWFILNDFDMATILPKDDKTPYIPSSRHRTGTLPFMAHSLLRDAFLQDNHNSWKSTRHLLCHDYESLFWVCLWCVLALFLDCLPKKARERNLRLLRSLEASDLDAVYRAKEDTCIRFIEHSSITLAPPAACLSDWLNGWTSLLCEVHVAGLRRRGTAKDFDQDTAGGVLSKDNILKVLTPLAQLVKDEAAAAPTAVAPKRQPRKKAPTVKAKVVKDNSGPEQGALVPEVPAVAPKRRSRVKKTTAEATAIKAAVMSRLRPRKTS